jgi:DNA polymerase III subunit epsilon
MREIVLDTETTGFEPSEGHRIVEIGCVELYNHVPTGKVFHTYLNPQREVPPEAARIHGLTTEFLKDKPLFTEKVGEFLGFLGDAALVIHNAEFDMKFLNAELKASGFKTMPLARATDTVLIAREKFPGQPASLDALCRRFKVDNTERKFHGALLDSELLAEVYLALLGGRQHGLALSAEDENASLQFSSRIRRQKREKRAFPVSAAELETHGEFLKKIKNALWTSSSSA